MTSTPLRKITVSKILLFSVVIMSIFVLVVIIIGKTISSGDVHGTGISQIPIIAVAVGFAVVLLYQKNSLGGWILVAVFAYIVVLPAVKDWWLPTPGTWEVTSSKYMGRASGKLYTLTDHEWLVFEWKDSHCVVADNKSPVLDKGDDRGDVYMFLSRSSSQRIEIRTLATGETWGSFTCR